MSLRDVGVATFGIPVLLPCIPSFNCGFNSCLRTSFSFHPSYFLVRVVSFSLSAAFSQPRLSALGVDLFLLGRLVTSYTERGWTLSTTSILYVAKSLLGFSTVLGLLGCKSIYLFSCFPPSIYLNICLYVYVSSYVYPILHV